MENKIINHGHSIGLTLDVYLFWEDGACIAYSPALDLSGYGESEEEAKKSFGIVVEEYVKYAIENGTLTKDLRNHGWKVRSVRQHKMSAPSFDTMLQSNNMFRDILKNKEYRKISEPVAALAMR